ncbi:MAG: STAS domain-containing protein [Phycisphaerae bacterium]
MKRRRRCRDCSLGTAQNLGAGRVFYHLSRPMTMALIPELREEIIELIAHYQPRQLILDLEALDRFGGAGLAGLVETMQLLPPGGRLYIFHPPMMARGIIQIGRLENLFTIVDDMPSDEAQQLLQGVELRWN